MLSSEERAEIEAELKQYPVRQGAAIDALRIVQKHRGWISDRALADVGEFLGMSPAELDSLATFYNLLFRKPVGRHVIFLCDSVSCWIMGYERLCDHLTRRLSVRLGETTTDGRYTLLPIPCLGACDRAPALMIGRDLHGGLEDPAKADPILDRYA